MEEGQQIGNYRVVRKIGEGGMGAVYEAVHDQIGRRAAVKVLHAEVAQNALNAQRFFNEARAVNIIRHPSLVEIFDFGALPEGQPYIVMEFLEGESLGARLRRLGTSLGVEALHLTRQIASALAAAHEKQIIHRDLKPDNVMIVKDAETATRERAKILDFGIAKVTPLSSTGQSTLKTSTDVVLGTPAYMAPEQCINTATVTERADVYSLGIILYEMLTAQRPFDAPTSVDIMYAQVNQPPRHIQQLLPPIPVRVADLVHAMLNKEPSLRPSMADVAAALEKIIPTVNNRTLPRIRPVPGGDDDDYETVTAPPTPRSGSKPPVRPPRFPTWGAVAAGSGLALLLAIALYLVIPRTPPPDPPGLGTARGRLPGGAAATALPAPAAAPAIWVLTSEPDGAQVLHLPDRLVLGTTPYKQAADAGTGLTELMVKAPEHFELKVSLERGRSETRHVKLQSFRDIDVLSGSGNRGPSGD